MYYAEQTLTMTKEIGIIHSYFFYKRIWFFIEQHSDD